MLGIDEEEPRTLAVEQAHFTKGQPMNDEPLRISPLHRVTLELSVAPPLDHRSAAAEAPLSYSFILGVASGGMSPFEYALLDKAPGDVVTLNVGRDNRHAIFEHLDPPLERIWNADQPVQLSVRVAAVAEVEPREIVKAMAAVGGCACDCGCGCG